jgi:addiction module RelE/StbE family toxin
VTEVRLARRAVEDLERLVDFLIEAGDPHAESILDLVENGLLVLRRHPLIGRTAERGLRELVISRGKSGYVALYDFDEPADVVTVLALKHQRELGW